MGPRILEGGAVGRTAAVRPLDRHRRVPGPSAHGHVVEISKVDGYGFIQTDEHRVYFNRASVLGNTFDDMDVGMEVAFVEEKGEKSPQASTVRVLGKHHYAAP